MKKWLPSILTICAAWSGHAAAQDFELPIISTAHVLTYSQQDEISRNLRERMAQQNRRDEDHGNPSSQRAAPKPNLAALRYTPSMVRRTANLARFVEKTRPVNPAGADELQTLFAQGDFIEKIAGVISPLNLRVDNVADAYALWWITAWQATRGKNDTPSRTLTAAVRDQAARAIGNTLEFVNSGDATKQEFAETLLVQSILIDRAIDLAKADPKHIRDLGVAINKGAETTGLDLRTMELTEKGFVTARSKK